MKGSVTRRASVTEEHITLIQHPGELDEGKGKFLGHITPKSGKAADIMSAIKEFCQKKKISLADLRGIGCDGTAVNTGDKGGVIALLEKHLKRPLHWLSCQLHANELPLRLLINELDGKTTGPSGFKGDVGKGLTGCEDLPIVAYDPIPSEDIAIDLKKVKLSTDQFYLLRVYRAVASGHCPEDVANATPGKVVHSRWLTTACRVLRLYMASPDPSDVLRQITEYVMYVYTPTWFEIKSRESIAMGGKHVFNMVTRLRKLPEHIQLLVRPSVQRNAYFAHSENFILSLVFDNLEETRKFGFEQIKKARFTPHQQRDIRLFQIPEINFDANQLEHLIDWEQIVYEPPLLAHLSFEVLNAHAQFGRELDMPWVKYIPSHTQSVERGVQLVTQVAAKVTGEEDREGMIHNTIASRNKMPEYESKKDFRF